VHRYSFDLQATLRLRELIAEYGRMCRLDGMTAQHRGQRLNEFVADLLRYWGAGRVEASVQSVGEIDVAFALDGTRFILEAKWERGPVSFDPIAKLSRRITQRLTGTRGVFLSMSGYTTDAVSDMLRGQQPDMLLLDQSHLEAMLSGLFSPADLLTVLMDRASYRGEVQVSLSSLLIPDRNPPLPALALGPPAGGYPPVITETAPGVHGEVVLHGTQPQDTVVDGITVDPQERLLLTTPAGIVRVDLSSGTLDWAAPIPGCRRSVLQRADGSILVICGETVLRWDGHDCQILAGGFTGGTSLLPGSDGQEWVFDYKKAEWLQFGMSVTLTRLGAGLGQEERHTIDFRAGIWNAVWLSGHRFYLAGDGHFGVVDLDDTTVVPIDETLRSPHPDQRGAIRIDEHTVMTATRHGTVYRIDVETGNSTLMARLDMLALGCDLASGKNGRAYVLEHRGSPRAFIPIVIALSGYEPSD
jgi:Holliday junction resolvase-like predicted endonuclease